MHVVQICASQAEGVYVVNVGAWLALSRVVFFLFLRGALVLSAGWGMVEFSISYLAGFLGQKRHTVIATRVTAYCAFGRAQTLLV